MRMHPASWLIALCLLSLIGCASKSQPIPDVMIPPMTQSWPREYSRNGNVILMYQPQVDSWVDRSTIKFRAAVAVTAANTGKTEYCVVACSATTYVDNDLRTVLLTNISTDVRFPHVDDTKAAPLKALVMDLLPNMNYLDISLDQVLACVREQPPIPHVALNYAPPPIYYSETPAVIVIYLGKPDFKPVEGTKLTFAVNTNWVIFKDPDTSMYYLLNGDSWLMAEDVMKGPWMAAKDLPAEFYKLPAGREELG